MGKLAQAKAQKPQGQAIRKQNVEGLLLHLIRGVKKHGSIDENYLRSILTRHQLEMTYSDLINE